MTLTRLLGGIILLIAGGLLLVANGHESLDSSHALFEAIGPTVGKLLVILGIGSGAFLLIYGRLQDAVRAAAVCVLAAVVIAAGYTYRRELRTVGDRVVAEVSSGHALRLASASHVEITRKPGGDFSVHAEINGRKLPMLVDTGATSVMLTIEAAKSAGLPLDFLRYDVVVETANGRTRAAAVTLETLVIGNIVTRRVPALIAEKGVLKTSLLGMTFLNRLDSYEVRGNKMMLRGKPAR